MSTLSKLFSGYSGGGHVAKNGKFSTTKNNHNRNNNGYPTVIYTFSNKLLKLWLVESYKEVMKEAKNCSCPSAYIAGCINSSVNTKLPSYLNPIYRRAYHQSKRAY